MFWLHDVFTYSFTTLHSISVFTAFDKHRFTTLAKKHDGATRESRDATNTIARFPQGTITKVQNLGQN